MTAPLVLITPCDHEATVKPRQSKKGPNALKWVVTIRGPKVTLMSGVKAKFCDPNEEAAQQTIASFLGIDKSTITARNAVAVQDEKGEPKATRTTTSEATTVVPSAVPSGELAPPIDGVASYAPQQLPLSPGSGFLSSQQYSVSPFMQNPLTYTMHGPHLPALARDGSQPCGLPPHAQSQIPFSYAGNGPPPALHNGGLLPLPDTQALMPPATVASASNANNVSTSGSHGMFSSGPCVISAPVPSSDVINAKIALFHPLEMVEGKGYAADGKTAIVPTAEQERIYQHAIKSPNEIDTKFTVRITAGAGAGKTTTMLQVAAKAARLGHSHITYVTYAKAAADDGAQRIKEALRDFPNPPIVEARTLHSCAMRLLLADRKEEFVEENTRLMDDESLQNFIKTVCDREIQDFLAHAKSEIASRNRKDPRKATSMMQAAERQVAFFIFKTFSQFCQSPYTVEQFKDPLFRSRHYYPTQKFHKDGGDGDKQGFPSAIYRSKIAKYADIACLVWDAATQQGIRTYGLEMKRAQLKALRIPGSLLLVDESQDMDGCQVDWISKQCNHGTHVYIVGDAAQTIYSFRGAKSMFMLNLKGVVDFELTKSWRFGPTIASIANVVLFSKHKSKQTQRENPSWQ